jgi:hypothetical protein
VGGPILRLAVSDRAEADGGGQALLGIAFVDGQMFVDQVLEHLVLTRRQGPLLVEDPPQ